MEAGGHPQCWVISILLVLSALEGLSHAALGIHQPIPSEQELQTGNSLKTPVMQKTSPSLAVPGAHDWQAFFIPVSHYHLNQPKHSSRQRVNCHFET